MNDSTLCSPLEVFQRLSLKDQQEWLQTLSDDERAALAYEWDRWLARPTQLPPTSPWRFWLIMAGRGFGKTRIGAEELRKAARRLQFPNVIGATADDARDIMVDGESGILAICPKWERPEYKPSKRQLEWPNGAKTLIFTADEPERLRGKQHMWLWADEVAAWRYPEAWDQAMFGLRLGPNPQAVVTTTPRPTALIRALVENPHCVVTRGSTYDNLANLPSAFADEIIRKYEGTRLGRQELEGELLEDEGLAYRFSEQLHVIPPFPVPQEWERYESMDFGTDHATAWLLYAVDFDGNLIVMDGLYEPGLPSVIAPKIKQLREHGWEARDGDKRIPNTCYADPSIWSGSGTTNRWGQPASTATEFINDMRLPLVRANNDRRAGYIRIAELLRVHDNAIFPAWHPRAGETGKPRLFIMDCEGTRPLIEQLKYAPLEAEGEGPLPGEAVSRKWEGPHGHAHASLRYGVMSRPSPSVVPPKEIEDPRAAALADYERRIEAGYTKRSRYQRV